MKKKLVSIYLVLAIVLSSYSIPTTVMAQDNYEENMYASNTCLKNFEVYWDSVTEDDMYYPDYYAGSEIMSNGKLKMYLTSLDQSIIQEITTICGTDDIIFAQSEHSYNELYQVQTKLLENYFNGNSYDIQSFSISIPQNEIQLYLQDTSSYSLTDPVGLLSYDCIKIMGYKPTIEKDEITLQVSEETVSEETVMPADIAGNVIVYPGGRGGLGNNSYYTWGTVGFCAIDSNTGDKYIITHGHSLENSTGVGYYYNYNYVGTIKKVLGSSEIIDASIIKLDRTVTISNKLYNRNARLKTATSTHYQMSSIANQTAYFKGMASASEKSGKISYEFANDGYHLVLSTGGDASKSPEHGDSGTAIYTKTSSTSYDLIGIIKAETSKGSALGISVASIKDAASAAGYSFYIFLNDTDYK